MLACFLESWTGSKGSKLSPADFIFTNQSDEEIALKQNADDAYQSYLDFLAMEKILQLQGIEP